MIVKHLETKNTKVTSQTINGFSFKAFVNSNTFTGGDTTFGSSKVDFSKTSVKAILNRNGKDYILFQDNLKILGLAATLNTIQQQAFYSGVDHSVKLGNGKSQVTFNIPLGGPIKISNDDYVYLEVTNQDGLFDTAYINSSFLEVKALKAIGYETFIPSIKSWNVQAGTSSESYSIGSGVLRTALLNYDKTDFTNQVVLNLNFASDRYNDGLTFNDLVNMKMNSFPKLPSNLFGEAGSVFEADQSFLLTDFNNMFNDLVLDIQFDGSQVAASKNYLVVWSYKTDASIVAKAAELATKHQDELSSSIAKASI